jgi:hypothetical protein
VLRRLWLGCQSLEAHEAHAQAGVKRGLTISITLVIDAGDDVADAAAD